MQKYFSIAERWVEDKEDLESLNQSACFRCEQEGQQIVVRYERLHDDGK